MEQNSPEINLRSYSQLSESLSVMSDSATEVLNRHFFQRENAGGQKAHEKMLKISNY